MCIQDPVNREADATARIEDTDVTTRSARDVPLSEQTRHRRVTSRYPTPQARVQHGDTATARLLNLFHAIGIPSTQHFVIWTIYISSTPFYLPRLQRKLSLEC